MPDPLVTEVPSPAPTSPQMPYRVVELAFGTNGRTRPAKVFGHLRPTEYLTDDEIAVWLYVQQLDVQIAALLSETALLRATLAALAVSAPGATVENVAVPPSPGIEEAVVTETTVPISRAEQRVWADELLGALRQRVSLGGPEPGVVPSFDGCQLPGGFVELAPGLVPAAESVVVPTEAAAPDVGTGDDAGVGTEPAAPKTVRRAAVEAALKESPHLSNAVLAERCEVSAEYVRQVRKQLEAGGELEPVTAVTGRDGVEQSVTKVADAA